MRWLLACLLACWLAGWLWVGGWVGGLFANILQRSGRVTQYGGMTSAICVYYFFSTKLFPEQLGAIRRDLAGL